MFLDLPGDVGAIAEQALAAREVEKGLVDARRLDGGAWEPPVKEHPTPESLARKAADLGVTLSDVEAAADELGLSVAEILEKLDLSAALDLDDGNTETLGAAAVSARDQRRRESEADRDRSARVRIAGYERREFDHGERKLGMMVATRRLETRRLTTEEARMLGEIKTWIRWVEAQWPDGYTDSVAERIAAAHQAIGWGWDERYAAMLHLGCTIALTYRQAGNRPPPNVPNSGAAIVANVKKHMSEAGAEEPHWLEAVAGELDGVLANVSTSIGLTYYRDENLSPAELLKRADLLLYEAKQAGRSTYRSGAPLPAMRPPNAA